MAQTSEVARLERRPEALVLQVDDLVADIEAGKIRIPRFQRALVWKDEDRRKLFDSIYCGYPVGTLLLWKHAALEEELEWAGLQVSAAARPDALFVVDGQQRLATLAVTLLGAEEPSGFRRLYFDPAGREVRMGTWSRPVPETWLPVSSAGDPSRLVEWLKTAALTRSQETAAKDFAKRVQQARFPAYVVDTDDEATVRRMFDRVNRSGQPLKASEVFDALHGSFGGERPSSLRDLTAGLARATRFGALDHETALGALYAIDRGEPLRRLDDILASLPDKARKALIKSTLHALRRAIEFVRDDAGIPHRRLVPYASALPVLALFFHRHPAPHPRSRLLLRRWFYRGAITGAHRGDVVGMRHMYEAIGDNEHRSVQSLLAATVRPRPTRLGSLEPFDARHARSRLELLALASLEPRLPKTGVLVDLFALLEEHVAIPLVCPTVRVAEHPLAGTLANRALSPARTRGGRGHRVERSLGRGTHRPRGPGLESTLGQASDPEILASHAISPEARAALVEGNGARFLEVRAKLLEEIVSRFLAARAEFDADDGPPVDALTIEDSGS
jgi:hypothetical protein